VAEVAAQRLTTEETPPAATRGESKKKGNRKMPQTEIVLDPLVELERAREIQLERTIDLAETTGRIGELARDVDTYARLTAMAAIDGDQRAVDMNARLFERADRALRDLLFPTRTLRRDIAVTEQLAERDV
jgi:hypothetical protein